MEPDLLDTPAAGPAAVRGGLFRVAGFFVGTAVTVVSAAVLFRQLGVDEGGRYVLVLSVVNLASSVTDAGLSSIGVRELATRREGKAQFLRDLLGLRLAFSVVGMAGACLYGVLAGFDGRLVAALLIAGSGVLSQNLQSTYITPLMADLSLVRVTMLDLGRQVATAVAIVAVAVAGGGLLLFLAAAPLAGLLALGATLAVIDPASRVMPGADPAAWRRLLADTLPYALAAAIGAVYFRLAILFVDLLSTDRQTGLFGASFRIVEVLVLLPQLAVSAALPIFSRAAGDDRQRLEYGLGVVTEAMAIFGAALALALAAGAPVAIKIVAGDTFDGAVPVLRLHAVSLLFTFLTSPLANVLLSLHRYRALMLASSTGVVALVTALALLVPDHGAHGAALATILGEATVTAGCALGVVRSGIPLRVPALPRIAVAAALAVVPAAVLPAIPAVLAAEIVFAGVLLLLRAVPEEALEIVRR